MTSYTIMFAARVEKALLALPREVQVRIFEQLQALAQNPFPVGSKKLKNRDGYRVRVGDYRIIYEVDTKGRLIIIVVVGHRKDIYQQ
ncbi:MAG: type II toxin-antitoxin system RelE/ParE family toxin [Pleurocapsa sp. SU_196_0]|nr:type II toxin-antitoxin system RelE/ParE family toxin [Pleurocapsa sp. SU_196_0]